MSVGSFWLSSSGILVWQGYHNFIQWINFIWRTITEKWELGSSKSFNFGKHAILSNYFLWLPTDNSKAERRLEKNPNISLNRSPTVMTDESDQSDVMLLCEGFKYQRHLTIEFLYRARTRFFDQLNTKALHQLRANQPGGGCVMPFFTIPTIELL